MFFLLCLQSENYFGFCCFQSENRFCNLKSGLTLQVTKLFSPVVSIWICIQLCNHFLFSFFFWGVFCFTFCGLLIHRKWIITGDFWLSNSIINISRPNSNFLAQDKFYAGFLYFLVQVVYQNHDISLSVFIMLLILLKTPWIYSS